MQPQRQPSGLRFLENLAYLVPGYQGYKQKDRRREEDSLLRARVIRELRQLLRVLDSLQERWAPQAGELVSEQLLHRRLRLEAVAESVRCAPYRSRTFFEADMLRVATLEQILEADLLILEDLSATREFLEDCWPRSALPKDLAGFLQPFDDCCARLEGHLIMREKLLASD